MDIGVAGRMGGQIGAGMMTAPMGCFTSALAAYEERYPGAVDGTADAVAATVA
jgi:hypothetical protein